MSASTAAPAAAAPALTVDAVAKRFGARTALRAVSFRAAPGEIVAVTGPNGAGKTTLLSILAGVLRADEGACSPEPSRVGWVPQQPALYSKLSARENLELFARLERLDDPAAAVARMLEQAGLAERARDEVGRLSGGNRQRLNIAIGLLADPPVLLLDEPSSSLDPRQRERLWTFVGSLAQRGTAVVFTTHNVGEAERYADRLLVLADGELLFSGSPTEFAELAGEEPGSSGGGSSSGRPDFEATFVAFLRARGH